MPVTAYVLHKFGVREGDGMRNAAEALGVMLLFVGILYLATITITGHSGFVRGDQDVAILGIALAVIDGICFTWILVYSQRLSKVGVEAGAVLGLRLPLYVFVAGGFAALGVDDKGPLDLSDIVLFSVIGFLLTIPPLYALQIAVSMVSTLTISALTALGPFVIFGLQMFEGRVAYSPATFVGLSIYFFGATLAAIGAVRATLSKTRQPAASDM